MIAERMKESQRRISSWILTLSILTACTPAEAAKGRSTEPPPNRTELPANWRFTSGPHDDQVAKSSEKVLYAIDIAPPELISCGVIRPDQKQLHYKFGALKQGIVYSLGPEDTYSPEHSIVRVKDNENIIWVYEHLNINQNLKLGQKVSLNQYLGDTSCETPARGLTSGEHVHVGRAKEVNGKLVKLPIDGAEIGGWTIHSGKTEYNGTMTKGKVILTADARDCLPVGLPPTLCRDEKGEVIINHIPKS